MYINLIVKIMCLPGSIKKKKGTIQKTKSIVSIDSERSTVSTPASANGMLTNGPDFSSDAGTKVCGYL